jgi:hypothetical protein
VHVCFAHEAHDFGAGFSRAARSRTYSGTATALRSAHASFCSVVKQQQLRQHCSAVMQPQARLMHGNGADWSLRDAGNGNGAPEAASTWLSSTSANTALRANRVRMPQRITTP